MKSIRYFISLLLFFSYSMSAAAQQIDTLKENGAIRQLIKRYEEAWNRHDPIGLAANYSSDATWVNWFGAYYKGRQDIEDHYRTTHNTYFKPSHYFTRSVEDIQYLTPDIAVAHVRTGLTDDARYPGETFEFRRMIVLSKKGGLWHSWQARMPNLKRALSNC
jgi:uncharacterized protein (TIGR02246 family)